MRQERQCHPGTSLITPSLLNTVSREREEATAKPSGGRCPPPVFPAVQWEGQGGGAGGGWGGKGRQGCGRERERGEEMKAGLQGRHGWQCMPALRAVLESQNYSAVQAHVYSDLKCKVKGMVSRRNEEGWRVARNHQNGKGLTVRHARRRIEPPGHTCPVGESSSSPNYSYQANVHQKRLKA